MNTSPERIAQLFDGLCHTVQATPDRRGWVHTACPECGKDRKHFGFNSVGKVRCFSCGFTASLAQLAERLNATPVAQPRQFVQEPSKPRRWQLAPERYLDDYCAALDRVQAWQAYKPLSLDTISRYRLGVGRLPSSQCEHRRLIYPLFQDGRIVGFRGRAITCDCPKWLTCGGSQTVCVNLDLVRPRNAVFIVENPVDAWLAMESLDDAVVIASTAGAGTWRDEWTQELVRRRPQEVIIWLDNDLAGCPNESTKHLLQREWMRQHPGKQPPVPNGDRLKARLRAAGLFADTYVWPENTPVKADGGWVLMNGMEVAA